VFLQIIDPRAFAGLQAFERQTSHVADACRGSRPAREGAAVRTPGEKGVNLAAQQKQAGVALYPSILPALSSWAIKLGVPEPLPHTGG
jgi:L-lactate dehydrogenase